VAGQSNVGARVDDEECAQQIPISHACKGRIDKPATFWITLASMSDRLAKQLEFVRNLFETRRMSFLN
jgi:hypothetical protein